MATEITGSSFSDFHLHAIPVPLRGVTQRDPQGMKVTRTGRIQTNTAASEWVIDAARTRFHDVSKCGIVWASNEETLTVAGKLVDPQTKGATPIRQNSKDGNLVLYMNNVFFDRPKLRPQQASWVSMTPHNDPDGPWFTIHLNLALATSRGRAASRAAETAGTLETALDRAAAARQDK